MTTTTPAKTIHQAFKSSDSRLNESMQSKSMRFAFAYENGEVLEQVMPLVKCRDYLKEQILYTYYDKKMAIFGFDTAYNVKNTEEYTGLLLDIPNDAERILFCKNFPILQEYEKKLGFEQISEYYFVGPQIFVKGDVLWQKSCLNISLYSLLLRTLSYSLEGTFTSIANGPNAGSVDGKMWKAMDGFEKITSKEQLIELAAKEDISEKTVDFVHNYTGAYYMLASQAAMNTVGYGWVTEEYKNFPTWVENW